MSLTVHHLTARYGDRTILSDVALQPLEASPSAAGSAHAEVRTLAALERVGAINLALMRLDRLSGGQRQIAGLAQAMVREPCVRCWMSRPARWTFDTSWRCSAWRAPMLVNARPWWSWSCKPCRPPPASRTGSWSWPTVR